MQYLLILAKTPGGLGGGMGGYGSGDSYRWNARKSTVEESIVLAMPSFRGLLHSHAAGTFTWTWTSGAVFSGLVC